MRRALVGELLQVRVALCGAFYASSLLRDASDTIFPIVSSHLATAPMRALRGACRGKTFSGFFVPYHGIDRWGCGTMPCSW